MTSLRQNVKRSGIMLCYPFEEKRLLTWNAPVIVQPKLDGERCRAVFSGEDNIGYQLFSSEQHEIVSVPHINQALNELYFSSGFNGELDGELYLHGMTFEQIHSRVSRKVNFHDDFASIEYHIFDLVDETIPQYTRTVKLTELPLNQPLKFVESHYADSFDQVMTLYKGFLNYSYEGMIVRHITAPYVRKRSTMIMKFKPKKSDYYRIVSSVEELDKHGNPKGTLGALVCTSDEGTIFNVGSGFTASQRRSYWEQRDSLPGKLCHVNYQHITPGRGVPRFPVFVEVMSL